VKGRRLAFIMGGLCSGLTIAGLVLSPQGSPVIWSVVNRGIGFAALWSLLWVGRIFVERTVELERTKAGLSQEVEQRKQVERALLTVNDQLESRIAQRTEQLQAALDRWALVAQATHDGVYDWDLTTRRVVYSPHWKAMHGFSQEDEGDASPEQWSERIHLDDRSHVLGHLEEYLSRKRQEFREEYRIRRCDGR
jgi:PAS domain-containing protein